MLEILALRALLAALPFAIWFAWRAWAIRNGRDMGATPWAWLFAGGATLVGLSLMATALTHRDNRGQVYVPAETAADGTVSGSHFERRPPARP